MKFVCKLSEDDFEMEGSKSINYNIWNIIDILSICGILSRK